MQGSTYDKEIIKKALVQLDSDDNPPIIDEIVRYANGSMLLMFVIYKRAAGIVPQSTEWRGGVGSAQGRARPVRAPPTSFAPCGGTTPVSG